MSKNRYQRFPHLKSFYISVIVYGNLCTISQLACKFPIVICKPTIPETFKHILQLDKTFSYKYVSQIRASISVVRKRAILIE